LDGRLKDLEARGRPVEGLRGERDALVQHLVRGALRVPESHTLWIVLKVHVEAGAAVKPGDAVALVAPLDPSTRQPLDPIVHLEINDKHCAEVAPQQTVRLSFAMYNHRHHGYAEAVLERVEPLGETIGGERRFRAVAAVTQAPFPLRPGAGCKAEIVVGRKRVYRIILEQ
ncbi:MAG TPA: hypothetical protein VEL76_16150, partial [Gemmataceae bacterium]|nr:hypothetical protein [Gemmataceae bacterium]